MRIMPANTKPLFCRMTYSHAQDSHPVRWAGSTNACTSSIINSPLTLLCNKVLATMFRYKISVFVILKPIQTKISVCFDPIIYPPGSHQLAGRLVCLAHGFLVCPIRSSYMSHQRWQRSIQLSSIRT